jgi:hypothetical protein
MRTIGTLGITAILSCIGTAGHSSNPPRLTIENATPTQVAVIHTAAQRFADANLILPDLTIRFGDDPADCFGHLAIFDVATTPWTITICSDLAFVLTHELAHAWLDSNMSGPTREQYLSLRDKANWDDKHAEWSDRGVEDAAFVIQQNLMITPRSPLSEEWQTRLEAYELLTDQTTPLRGTVLDG